MRWWFVRDRKQSPAIADSIGISKVPICSGEYFIIIVINKNNAMSIQLSSQGSFRKR